MSSINITVEVYGGTDIKEACQDAVALADRLQISVWFNFNEVRCLARPGDNYLKIVEAFYSELKSTHTIKMASAGRG